MNVFISTLFHETNTFSPKPCERASFDEHLWVEGAAIFSSSHDLAEPSKVWRDAVLAMDGRITAGLALAAMPSGPASRELFEEICTSILDRLRQCGQVDLVVLFLHGAMVADETDDCEGELLMRIRQQIGTEPVIGVLLDLHCHVTQAMLENADVLITCKEYPHIDFAACARQLFELCVNVLSGHVQPARVLYECGLVNCWGTSTPPMRGFVEGLRRIESQGRALSVSFVHGFPWADVQDGGARLLVITDGAPMVAARLARALDEELWAIREAAAQRCASMDDALDRALVLSPGPVVLADVADNAGGGAPGDSTFILHRILERGIVDAAVSSIWDPQAVRTCLAAGEGTTLKLRFGGNNGRISGPPLERPVLVRALRRDHAQTGLGGSRMAMGDAAWITTDGVDVVLNSIRTQTLHPDAMTGLGLPVTERSILVVKSTQHFLAGFGPHARAVFYVSTPGALEPDFAAIAYRKFTRPFWPRVAQPFAEQERLIHAAISPRRSTGWSRQI